MKCLRLFFVTVCMSCNVMVCAQTPEEIFEQGNTYWKEHMYSQAAESWRKAAEMGNAEAQDRYAECLRRGDGVEQKDYTTAVAWYMKAIRQYNVKALYHLGICYYYGQGVAVDYKKAIAYYSEAALYGVTEAEESLKNIHPEAISNSFNEWGFMYIDHVVIPFKYDSVGYYKFLTNELPVKNNKGSWGLINKADMVVIPFEYEAIHYGGFVQNEYLLVKKHGKWGVVDRTNHVIIPYEYDEITLNYPSYSYMEEDKAELFADGLAAVKKNGKWGFIDINNKTIIPYQYDDAYSFRKGTAVVKKNNKWGEINNKNQVVTPFEYDDPDDLLWGREEYELFQIID